MARATTADERDLRRAREVVRDLVGEVDLDAGVRVGESRERSGHEVRRVVDEVFC